MKKFLLKILIVLASVLVLLCALAAFDVFVVGGMFKYNYQASVVDKLERLETVTGPKIILVGHSNVSFGFDSERLEEAMGMPVVNLGVHGSLGNTFHEDLARQNIGEGDIVVVCHTDFADDGKIGDYPLAWITVDNNAKIAKIIRPTDYAGMAASYPDYLCNSLFNWVTGRGNRDYEDSCYSRTAFNKYGDIERRPAGLAVTEDFFKDANVTVPGISEECMKGFNEFCNFVRSKGAEVVIAGYPVAYGKYSEFTEEDFNKFEEKLKAAASCDVISHYADYFYPYSYFYNTALHLTKEGAEVRTDQLASDLKAWQSAKQG
ncbi:MAG: hypothetical protein K6G89_00030 [Clostridia bacterium]|nr:hypothetical protein [Clostridia bacterium]